MFAAESIRRHRRSMTALLSRYVGAAGPSSRRYELVAPRRRA
ncbi:hypothetical protein [Lysobacter gummosus]